MDTTKPPESVTQDLKRKRRERLAFIWAIIIIVFVVGVAYTGLVNIPGVSAVLGTNKPKDLGIRTSPDDLLTLKEKIPMTISGASTDYAVGTDLFNGELSINTQVTSEEITAWLQRFEGDDPIFSDVQVRFVTGGMELSGVVHKYVSAPAYATIRVLRVDDKTIDLAIDSAKLGAFSVPEKYRLQAEEFFEERINVIMDRIEGFSMDTWELHDGYEVFKGTLPRDVRRSTQGWSGLLEL